MNAQTVSLNQIPTINCPSGNMYICGTYSPPTSGGPYNVNFIVEIYNLDSPYLVTGGNEYLTTLTSSTFCFTVPVSIFGTTSPLGNYDVSVQAQFTQVNAPFAEVYVTDLTFNDTGVDIFYSNTCPIVANDDGLTISQCNSGTINVFSNDTFLANAASSSNVILTQLTSLSPITFNSTTGIASIPAGTAPGTYNISYQICNPANASQCDTSIISFMVTPAPITALNNTFSINTCSGGTTTSVLLNDTLCGSSISTPVNVSFVGSVPIVGATISNTGIISIPAGTPTGSYIFTYKVCHTAFPTVCSNNATITINVTAPIIIAGNDNFTTAISSLAGGFTPSVFTNDSVNGVLASSGNVTVTLISSTPNIPLLNVVPSGLFINSLGIISVPVGVTNGTYIIVYSITQVGCVSNVTYGSVTIVINSVPDTPDIVAGVRANSTVSSVDTQTDNKIIITGTFSTYNSINRYGIARLNDDLTLDMSTDLVTSGALPSEAIGSLIAHSPYDMKVVKNIGDNLNKIMVIGSFTGFSGSYIQGRGIARLLPNGAIDPTFNTGSIPVGATRGISGSNNQVRTIYIYPDTDTNGNVGKIIIGGMFTTYNGYPVEKLARLNVDGTLDIPFAININTIIATTASATNGFNSTPEDIAVQSDGKIIVGGYFTQFNGKVKRGILRLNNDGTFDDTFNSYTGVNPCLIGSYIRKIIVQPDDRIIIGGFFSFYNNVPRNSIARLYANGTLDTTFNPGTGFFPVQVEGTFQNTDRGSVRSMVYEPAVGATSAKLFVSGDFTKYNNAFVQKVIALNCGATGAGGRNNSFRVGPNLTSGGPNDNVWAMKKQGAKIILGGKFTTYNGLSALRVTRIFPTFDSFQSNELKGNYSFYDSEPEIDINLLDEKNDYVIYPNPSEGLIKVLVSNNSNEIESIQVYNHLGQIILKKNFENQTEIDLDLTTFGKGLYFVIINNDNSNIKKILKQ